MAKKPPPAKLRRTLASDSIKSNRSRVATFALGLLISVLTFLAFVPALQNQFLDWDDDVNFLNNPDFRGLGWDNLQWMFKSFHSGHYQPVAWLTLGWDCEWGQQVFGEHPEYGKGMDPRAFHFTSNLLHAINAALVYLLGLRLIAAGISGDQRARNWTIHLAAAFAALLWSVHPMRVENVAWITERRDLVSALLLIVTLLMYLRAANTPGAARWRWIAIACVVYALSLMSKVSGVPMIAALIALDWYPLRRLSGTPIHSRQSVWLEKLPFLLLALTFAYIAVKGQAQNNWLYPLEGHPLHARVVQMCYGLGFYLWKSLLPFDLLPLYELRRPLNLGEARFVLSVIGCVLGCVLLLWMFWRGQWRGLLAALIGYAAFLGPVLGLFQNGPQIVADRYSYLPLIGISLALCGGIAFWWLQQQPGRSAQRLIFTLACSIILGLGALTWEQCKVWRDSHSLWSYNLRKDPNSTISSDALGVLLAKQGRTAEAIPYFQRAVQIEPHFKPYREKLRRALRETGKMQELLAVWVDEAQFGEYDAAYHFNQGMQTLQSNDAKLAMEHFSVSLLLDSQQPRAHYFLAAALERLKRDDDAIRHYRIAVQLDPNFHESRYAAASLLARTGRSADSTAELEILLKLAPDHAQARQLLQQLQQRR